MGREDSVKLRDADGDKLARDELTRMLLVGKVPEEAPVLKAVDETLSREVDGPTLDPDEVPVAPVLIRPMVEELRRRLDAVTRDEGPDDDKDTDGLEDLRVLELEDGTLACLVRIAVVVPDVTVAP